MLTPSGGSAVPNDVKDVVLQVLAEGIKSRDERLRALLERWQDAQSRANDLEIQLNNIRGMALDQFPELRIEKNTYELVRQAFVKMRSAARPPEGVKQ